MSRDTPLCIDVPEHRNLRLNLPPGKEIEVAKLETPAGDADSAKGDAIQQTSAKQSVYDPPPVPPPPGGSTQPASEPQKKNDKITRVRARVNGIPIFDDEVLNNVMPLVGSVKANTQAEREAELKKLYFSVVDRLVDDELLKQDAFRRMREQPKMIEAIKASAMKESEKKVAEILKKAGLGNMEEFKRFLAERGTTLESIRHGMERDYIAKNYLYSLIERQIKQVSPQMIRAYYDDHQNEFQQIDKVKWLDLFIAVGPKHPTLEDARAFAEEVRERWAHGEDFKKLLDLSDGESRNHAGEGAGELRGEIRPPELEPYLFAMKAGEIAPTVELTTGVHVFSVAKRDYTGVKPFNDQVQKEIDNKLKSDVVERERRPYCQQLREEADIKVDKEFP